MEKLQILVASLSPLVWNGVGQDARHGDDNASPFMKYDISDEMITKLEVLRTSALEDRAELQPIWRSFVENVVTLHLVHAWKAQGHKDQARWIQA